MESQQISQGFWRRRFSIVFAKLTDEYGWGALMTVFALLWLIIVGAAWAEASESDRSDKDDEYSFNWLDPDKKIYVLQNRKYLKGGHPLLSVMGGVGFSNPYRSTLNIDPRLAYYANETWGIEVFYTMTSNTPNSTEKALGLAAPNAIPKIREIRSQYGAMIHYVPWYAKINVFNAILYFDWYFGAGAGTVQTYVNGSKVNEAASYTQQDLFGLFFSTGQQFHLSQRFVFRLDVTGAFYQAPIYGLSGESSWYSNYNFGLGLGWRI